MATCPALYPCIRQTEAGLIARYFSSKFDSPRAELVVQLPDTPTARGMLGDHRPAKTRQSQHSAKPTLGQANTPRVAGWSEEPAGNTASGAGIPSAPPSRGAVSASKDLPGARARAAAHLLTSSHRGLVCWAELLPWRSSI